MRAPITWGGGGGNCDEIVGRFCLTFEPNGSTPPARPEQPAVGKAREEAVRALERAAAAAPADGRAARGLVRLLVESRRDSAAVVAAARYARAAPGRWAELLQAFALHAAGDDTAADRHFARGLPGLPEKELRRMRLDWLVAYEEAGVLKKLEPGSRSAYEAALWKLADPLYLTPGNEVRGEFLARYVWSRMLSELTLVRGMESWGDDLEQLTLRYGVPTARERVPAQLWQDRDGMVEHFDPASLPFLPESLLTVGVRPTPAPGEKWALDDPRARTGFAPVTVRKMVLLPVQLTRFPAGDSVLLRVDGAVALDSVARQAEGHVAVAGLFLLPSPQALLRGDTAVLRTLAAPAPVRHDSAWYSLSTTLAPGHYVYSAELLERGTRYAARSRYLVELPAPAPPGSPLLSDVLLAQPFARHLPEGRTDPLLRALPEPVVAAGDTLGLYAEASRLAGARRYRVELELGRAGAPPVLERLGGWLKRRLGSGSEAQGVRASWWVDAPPVGASRPVVLATDVVVPRLSPGLYTVCLDVTGGGGTASSLRLLRVVAPRKR